MNQRITFYIVFFVMMFIMNLATFQLFFWLTSLKGAFLISLVFAVVCIASFAVHEKVNSWITYFFYKSFSILFGFIYFGFWFVLIANILSLTTNFNTFALAEAALFGTFFVTLIGLVIGNTWIIRRFTVKDKRISENVRIVHLSDLHLLGKLGKRRFEKVFRKALKQKPDVIVITGDMFDGPSLPPKDCFSMTKELDIPILFTLGNHEEYAGISKVKSFIDKSSIKLLQQEIFSYKGITFIGADDSDLGKSLEEQIKPLTLSQKNFSVLLFHRPAEVFIAQQKKIDLMLSGHTHAGQFFPFNFVVKRQFKFYHGLYKVGKMLLYVSPGAGFWYVPMRIGSRNTIAVFDLEKG